MLDKSDSSKSLLMYNRVISLTENRKVNTSRCTSKCGIRDMPRCLALAAPLLATVPCEQIHALQNGNTSQSELLIRTPSHLLCHTSSSTDVFHLLMRGARRCCHAECTRILFALDLFEFTLYTKICWIISITFE